MAIDYQKLRHWPFPDVEQSYRARDAMLYALGLGLGADPMDAQQLPVDPGLRVLRPLPGMGEHHRHRRQRPQALLIDEAQLRAVQGIGAVAEAQRVEHRVPGAVAVLDVGEGPVLELLIVDRHRLAPLRPDPR